MSAFKRVPHGELEVLSGEKTAEEYLRMQRTMGRFYLKGFLATLAKLEKSGDFLEIGSGPGYQTVQVARRHPNARIHALEPSQDMIAIAEQYVQQEGVENRISFTRGLVEDGAVMGALGRFDVVYSTFSLHHWRDPLSAILNIHKVLKDNGVALICDFTRKRFMYWVASFRKGVADSIRASYTKDELEHIMRQARMESFRIETKFLYLHLLIQKTGDIQR